MRPGRTRAHRTYRRGPVPRRSRTPARRWRTRYEPQKPKQLQSRSALTQIKRQWNARPGSNAISNETLGDTYVYVWRALQSAALSMRSPEARENTENCGPPGGSRAARLTFSRRLRNHGALRPSKVFRRVASPFTTRALLGRPS